MQVAMCGSCSVLKSTCENAALCESGLLVQMGYVVWELHYVGVLLR